MTEIARAWLVGHGLRLVPRVPFEVARPFGDERVALLHHGPVGNRSVLVDDQRRVALGRATSSIGEALDFFEDDATAGPGWRVMTADVHMPFPPGLTLWSTPPDQAWPFELTMAGGTDDEMMHLRGPFDRLDVDGLLHSGVQLQARAARSNGEVAITSYAVGGQTWQQWLGVIRLWDDAAAMLLTAQAPSERADALFEHAATIADGLAPRIHE